MMDSDLPDAHSRLLDAVERLIYAGGIHATGMDAIVKASGMARKTLYRHYPTKEALVAAALARRDERWMQWFIGATSAGSPRERVLSVFAALRSWFASPGFHGCAFLNAAGEIGDAANPIRAVARRHKERLLAYLGDLAGATGHPDPGLLASQLLLLVDGATSSALVFGAEGAGQAADQAAAMADALFPQ